MSARPNLDPVARATTALYSISPDVCRDDWVKACMGFHAAGGDFDTFNDWSAGGSTYNPHACRSTWNSAKPGKGVGEATLFYLAKVHGWKDSASYTPAPRPIQAPVSTPAPAPAYRPGMAPAEVWARCEAATIQHPYIVEKQAAGVLLHSLRVLPAGDALPIHGEPMAGALVVPVIRPDNSLASLQFIALPDVAARLKAKGKPGKLNLPGAPLEDGFFTVGELVPGGRAYIVEGIGTAWSCWQINGEAAVVCFGWGRVRKVARLLRQRDPSARLVLVPDVGKEADADKIAQEVNAAVVRMPDGWPKNSDVNDLMQRDGGDALADLLDTASFPATNNDSSAMTNDYAANDNAMPSFEGLEGQNLVPLKLVPVVAPVHALAKYVQIGAKPKAVRWVIPGFIGHGVTIIAGAHGAGKTTALLPLAMVAAGLHSTDNVLAPKHWRHVVYIVEDAEQAQRIISGVVAYGRMGINPDDVAERLHIVEAKRLPPSEVAKVGKTYREEFTRAVNGVDILPLVVIDTKAATLELENENDNSEASAAMAALKQGFDGLPVWLVGHVAKQSIGATKDMTLRGGSAFEADANQVLYLVQEGEVRYLTRGKTRFDAKWKELQINSEFVSVMAEDEFGDFEEVTLRWGICTPPEQSRNKAKEQAKELEAKEATGKLRYAIRAALDSAWTGGHPLNRAGVKALPLGKTQTVSACIQNLIDERWLYEVAIPASERKHPKQDSFLVSLSTPEREAFVTTGELPDAKLVIPKGWKKEVPSVPGADQ